MVVGAEHLIDGDLDHPPVTMHSGKVIEGTEIPGSMIEIVALMLLNSESRTKLDFHFQTRFGQPLPAGACKV